MSWLFLAFASALFLGFYDLAKKKSVNENAVFPVLFICSAIYAILMSPVLFLGFTEHLPLRSHLFLLGKASIVGISWALTYHAIAKLPLSMTTTIRALAPVFTIFIAVCFMEERPKVLQWAGIFICICNYFLFSIAGKKEIGKFFNKSIFFMLLGTLLAACSGIYDKFIIQRMHFNPTTVQTWFSFYMVFSQFLICSVLWFPKRKTSKPFQFRKSFLLVALFLIIADRCYFLAISDKDALISLITVFRRSSVLIGFIFGIFLLKEKKSFLKFLAFFGILSGLILIVLGK